MDNENYIEHTIESTPVLESETNYITLDYELYIVSYDYENQNNEIFNSTLISSTNSTAYESTNYSVNTINDTIHTAGASDVGGDKEIDKNYNDALGKGKKEKGNDNCDWFITMTWIIEYLLL